MPTLFAPHLLQRLPAQVEDIARQRAVFYRAGHHQRQHQQGGLMLRQPRLLPGLTAFTAGEQFRQADCAVGGQFGRDVSHGYSAT
ncbi:hypothetical protein D3C71_1892480 [compost metagenome]